MFQRLVISEAPNFLEDYLPTSPFFCFSPFKAEAGVRFPMGAVCRYPEGDTMNADILKIQNLVSTGEQWGRGFLFWVRGGIRGPLRSPGHPPRRLIPFTAAGLFTRDGGENARVMTYFQHPPRRKRTRGVEGFYFVAVRP